MLFLQGSCQSPSGNKTCDQIIIDLDNNIKKLHHLSDILDIEEFIYLKGHEIASVDEVIYHHDKIVILDKNLKEICCYSTAGEYLYSIGRKGRGPQEFINPIDISITNSGLVYILDDTLKILVYNVDGTFNKAIKLPTFFSEMHAIDDNNIALLHASDGKCAKYELTIISSKGKVKSTFLPIPENRIDIPYGYKKSFRYFDGETHFILPFDNSIYALEGKEVKPIFRVQYKKMATRDIIGLIVLSLVFFNLSVLDTKLNNVANLNLYELKTQLAHAAEIPEVTITCSSGSYGRCFKRVDTDDPIVWYYCEYSGYQSDYCEPN